MAGDISLSAIGRQLPAPLPWGGGRRRHTTFLRPSPPTPAHRPLLGKDKLPPSGAIKRRKGGGKGPGSGQDSPPAPGGVAAASTCRATGLPRAARGRGEAAGDGVWGRPAGPVLAPLRPAAVTGVERRGGRRGGCTPRLTEEAAPRGLRREPYLPCPPWRGGGSGAAAGTRGGLGWVGLGWAERSGRAAGSSAPCSDPSGRGSIVSCPRCVPLRRRAPLRAPTPANRGPPPGRCRQSTRGTGRGHGAGERARRSRGRAAGKKAGGGGGGGGCW